MVEKFIQLKKRAALKALLYAALIGGSAAALVFGVLFAILKRVAPDFPWYGYLLTCGGVFLLAGGLLLLFTYPTTKRFAKRLDEEFSLGEKVRTTVEYCGQSGAILDMQRAQTQAVLSTLPKKKKSFGWAVKSFLLPILAVATVTASIFVPKKVKTAPPEPIFQTSLYNVRDLQALIRNVQGSALSAEMIGVYDSVLLPLLELIQSDSPKHKEVIASVDGAMLLIMTATKEHNTYNAFAYAAQEVVELQALRTALKESGIAYKSVEGANLYSFTTLKDKQENILGVVSAAWQEYVRGLGDKLRPMQEDAYVSYVTEYVGHLDGVLNAETVKKLPQEEGLKVAITAMHASLQKSLSNIADPSLGIPFESAKASTILSLEESYNVNASGNAVTVLGEQAYAYMMKDYSLQALSRIFGRPIPDEGEDGSLGGGEESGGGSSGGGGSGSMEYPDDGTVLYPGNGQYEEYGKVLNEYGYYQAAMELLEANTEISEELKERIKEYFSNLQTKEN